MSQDVTLSAKQVKAIDYLVIHGNITAAAKAAGINRRTIQRWLQEPAFQQALAAAEGQALAELRRRLIALRGQAVDTLAGTMNDPNAPASSRVRAADTVIRRILELSQLVTLEERIAKLEELLNASKTP